jgi:Concanavalin A-like lectin/glucanases superfamily
MKPLFTLALVALPAFAAFPNGYSYCKVVTTQHTMVPGTNDLTNYPLTVILTDNDLRTVGNLGFVNNANGYDIGFYPDCSGSGAALKWEMESYSPTTGAIVAHVLRPTLSHTADDTIGMYYGGSFSSFQSTASAVWNTNYIGVWHLPNGTVLTAQDSTSNGNNGTVIGPTAATGQLGGGASYDGAPGRSIDVGSGLGGLSTLTFSGWLKPNGFGDDGFSAIIGCAVNRAQATNPYTDALLAVTSGTIVFALSPLGGPRYFYSSAATLTTGNWFYIVATYDGSTLRIFQNGSELGTGMPASGITTPNPPSNSYLLGQMGIQPTDIGQVNGMLDEIRISNTNRSADWILTEYRNQTAPGTYISAGSRITGGGGGRVRHVVIGGN